NAVVDLDEVIGGQNRIANLIHYASPKIAGAVTLNLELSPAEGADVALDGQPDNDIADIWGSPVVYEKNNVYAALAYETNQLARRSLDGITRADITRFVVTWKPGRYEIGALLQSSKDILPQSNAEDTAYLISGAINAGNFKFKGQYGAAEGENSGETGSFGILGVDYKLSNKTFLYTYAAFLKADESDLQDDALGIGVSHSF